MKLLVWIRSPPFFLRLTGFTRILLCAGFVPTGLVKLLGRRFTTLPEDNPIGAFFEALYATGGYWRFLGAAQVAAGLLVLVPRLAHVGAALFLVIMANIFVITVSVGFGGTAWVTGSMLLAVLYLCAWDYERFGSFLTARELAPEHRPPPLRLDRLESIGFGVFAVALLVFFLLTRGLSPVGMGLPTLGVGFSAGLFTLIRFLTTGRRMVPGPRP